MELDLKGLGKKDMLALKNVKNERRKIIHDSSADPIFTQFLANEIASNLHPTIQYVKVAEILEAGKSAKTFVLIPDIDSGTKKLAYFRPGQYVCIQIQIEDGIYKRPYTISCSPKKAMDNKYTLTIKRRNQGIVSNYFIEKVKVGDTFSISGPKGNFYYEPIRDAKNIIAIAGGSGITPFISMAEAVMDGILDLHLTILYGARTKEDFLFFHRFEEMKKKSKRIQVEYILSEEDDENFISGFITKELIEKYMHKENSYFLCGPLSLYEKMNVLFKELNIPNKYIRYDSFFGRIDLNRNEEYNLTVLTGGKKITILCNTKETLLSSMEKNGILAPSQCHVGKCGFCRSKLKSGKVKMFDDALLEAEKGKKYIHPCATFPESDVVIELPF